MHASWKALISFTVGAAFASGIVYMAMKPEAPASESEKRRTVVSEPRQIEMPGVRDASTPEPKASLKKVESVPAAPRPVKADRPFRFDPVARTEVPADLPAPPDVVQEYHQPDAAIPVRLASNPAVPPPPEPNRVTIAAGTVLDVILAQSLSSEYNAPGDKFTATLDRDMVIDGFVIGARGARVEGEVVAAERSGRVKGTAMLALELRCLTSTDGQMVDITTDPFTKEARKRAGRDAAKVGGAASLGALIGGIAGGGSGAAIGAAVGGAAGTGVVLGTRGAPAEFQTEERLRFRLNKAVTVVEQL